MNKRYIVFLVLCIYGNCGAIQDIEEDLLDLLKNYTKGNNRDSRKQPAVPKNVEVTIQGTDTIKKELTYCELCENFEEYKDRNDFSDVMINKNELMQKVTDEIACLELMTEEQHWKIVEYGALSLSSIVVICFPWIPHEMLSHVDDCIKAGVSFIGTVGSIGSVFLLSKVAAAYKDKISLLERHKQIKEWLTHLE